MFSIKQLFQDELKNFKLDNFTNKIIISAYSFMPLFLIVGTAVSELAIISLSLYFIFELFYKKEKILDNTLIYGLLIIYISLIVNLIFSNNFSNSFLRNIFFIKYIIFTLGTVNFISKKNYRISFIYKVWILIFLIFTIDMFIQFFLGKNLIGIESPLKFHRVSGFMGDELKAGSLVLSFGLILSSFIIGNTKFKNFGLFLIFFFLAAIFISGDRSNFFKSLIAIFFIIFFLRRELFKKITIFSIILISFIFFIISNFQTFEERYNNKIFKDLAKYNFNILNYIENTEYGKVYYTGLILFKNNKFFGVGNKNFRLLCKDEEREKFLIKNNIKYETNLIKEKFEEKFRCNTHPHQIYIEILAEHGAFGFIIFIILIIIFIKNNLFTILKTKDLLLSCQFIIILITFIPILPGGSFFTSFNSTIFWINLSLFYSYKKIIQK